MTARPGSLHARSSTVASPPRGRGGGTELVVARTVFAVVIAAGCSGSRDRTTVCLCDANNVDARPIPSCDPIAQTGCLANEKCTWIIGQVTPTTVGFIFCAPLDGNEVNAGESCVLGEPGPRGFDDCARGAVCVDHTCKAICDLDAAEGCAAQQSCVQHEDLFLRDNVVVAGVCEPP